MLKVVAFGLVVSLICCFMQSQSMELTQIIRMVGGTILIIFIVTQLEPIWKIVNELAIKAHLPLGMMKIILKTVGIAYIGQFASTLCSDMGESAIANSIDTCAKIAILLAGMPVLLGLLDMITTLLT